jgi:hypothetical protein
MNTFSASQVLLALSLALPHAAWAGGSFESVLIKNFVISNEVEYQLSVSQVAATNPKPPTDPYLGQCSILTVHGTYAALYSILKFPQDVTRAGHVSALAHLRASFQGGKAVNFGWLGNGFAPLDPKNPCVVRSRALYLRQEQGITAVLSLHDAV